MDKRQEILAASQVLFSQFGLRKVTTDDIAREAGISKATIYRYYKNKMEIFEDVVNLEAGQLLMAIENAVTAGQSVVDKFKAHLLTKMAKIKELINFYHVTEDHSDNFWPYIDEVRTRFIIDERAILRDILKSGIAAGELNDMDVDRVANMMVVSLKSQEYDWAIMGQDISLEEYVDLMIDIILNGIRKR